jgi:hypothetical protein
MKTSAVGAAQGNSNTGQFHRSPTARFNASASLLVPSVKRRSPITYRLGPAVISTWLFMESHDVTAFTCDISAIGISAFCLNHNAFADQCSVPCSTTMSSTPNARQMVARKARRYATMPTTGINTSNQSTPDKCDRRIGPVKLHKNMAAKAVIQTSTTTAADLSLSAVIFTLRRP